MRKIFASIRDGISAAADWFEEEKKPDNKTKPEDAIKEQEIEL
jgi:hypothetical protein